jgi:hypothetical protein
VTRRLQHRRDDPDAVRERTTEPSAPPAASLLDLQRSAGNAAVARVLAREPAPGAPPVQLYGPAPPPNINLGPLAYRPPELAPEVKRAVDAYLSTHDFKAFAISAPMIVDQVRRNVPEAADASPEAIRERIAAIVGAVPESRAGASLGQQSAQKAASISNMFPKPPTSVTVGSSKTSVTLHIVGAELKTAQDGAKVTAKADKEGGEAEIKKGDASVGVSGKWDGSEFGLKTEVAGIKFESKVHRQGSGWGWTGGLVIPLFGEEVDELPDIGGAVTGAHAAIAESFGYLQGGGSLTDGFVKDRMGKIKPAIDAVGAVAARKKPGATLRVTGSAEGGGWSAGVSLVIIF